MLRKEENYTKKDTKKIDIKKEVLGTMRIKFCGDSIYGFYQTK